MLKDILDEDVVQALEDAGCDKENIKCFLKYMNQDKIGKGLTLLEEHRKNLLDRVHIEEKQISRLDYLVYKIKK